MTRISPSMLCLVALFTSLAHAETSQVPLADVKQLLVVTTADWASHTGSLRQFEKVNGNWQPLPESIPVVIGKNGAAWGLGLHPGQTGRQKQEGDGKSPAGIFALNTAFGYETNLMTGMTYRAMTADDYCVDVPTLPLYNRIVNRVEVGAASVAGSTEPMRRDLQANGDQQYRLGLEVAHNPNARSGAGSCIFVHIWKGPDSGTAGCTAMTAENLTALLGWLEQTKKPALVLLPIAEYQRVQADWQLPALP